jgi:hypothetical protein
VLVALGLSPLSGTEEELRARINAHIAERRKDKEFMARLDCLLKEDDLGPNGESL